MHCSILHALLLLLITVSHPFVAVAAPDSHKDSHDWVDLQSYNVGFVFDIRYATRNNFTGEILYKTPRAFMRRAPAEALVAVQAELRRKGLGLKIFDAYRPLPVQQKMWDLIRDERYVSNPAVNAGRHTRGAAVDVTLVDLNGQELPMPTEFDDFTERAHSRHRGVSRERKRNRDALRRVMKKHGFTVYPTEWWHFDYRNWEAYPPSALPFEALLPKRSSGVSGVSSARR